MGIQGLLKIYQEAISRQSIQKYQNKTIGIDASLWLYKAMYPSHYDYLTYHSHSYLQNFHNILTSLTKWKIKPIFVFDGRCIKEKANTVKKRQTTKKNYVDKGVQMIREGNKQEGKKIVARGIGIDGEVVYRVIEMLKRKGYQLIVAPFEADPQLSYLYKIKYIDEILTQDSDLLLYSQQNAILYKLKDNMCSYYPGYVKQANSKYLKMLLQLNQLQYICACALGGCDYLKIKGLGIKGSINKVYQATKKYACNIQKQKIHFQAHKVHKQCKDELVEQNKDEQTKQKIELIKDTQVEFIKNQDLHQSQKLKKTSTINQEQKHLHQTIPQQQFKSHTYQTQITRLISHLPAINLPSNIILLLVKIVKIFKHSYVWDPLLKKIVLLNQLPQRQTIDPFPEQYVFSEQVANGIIDPFTLKKREQNIKHDEGGTLLISSQQVIRQPIIISQPIIIKQGFISKVQIKNIKQNKLLQEND